MQVSASSLCAESEFLFNAKIQLIILILAFTLTPNRNDGDEPDYMAADPTQWLSSTMEACCKKFFDGYSYDACMDRYPRDQDDCIVKLFYPDWNGSNKGCIDDGK